MTDLERHDYARLLAEIRPRPIRTAGDYSEQRGWLERLMCSPTNRLSENEAVSTMIELISLTLAAYEAEHSPSEFAASAPHELLAHLIESGGRDADALAVALGVSVATLTDYAIGRQPIPTQVAVALAGQFGVDPELFIARQVPASPAHETGPL